jgi:hypothetical protein
MSVLGSGLAVGSSFDQGVLALIEAFHESPKLQVGVTGINQPTNQPTKHPTTYMMRGDAIA